MKIKYKYDILSAITDFQYKRKRESLLCLVENTFSEDFFFLSYDFTRRS